MIIFKSINKLNKEVNFKASIGFVPTMGSLHKGHISLVKNCQKTCDKTLVSIFINPSQFNRKTDYKNYPRTLDKDIKILKKLKVDYVLVPDIKEIYSRNTPRKISINKKYKVLCGKYRPGHFEGVLAVINKFLKDLKVKKIFLGEKDFQQYFLIKNFVKKRFKTKVVLCKTIRMSSSLPYSSRNKLLDNKSIIIAQKFTRKIIDIVKNIKKNTKKTYLLQSIKSNSNIKIEYLELRNKNNLSPIFNKKNLKLFVCFYIKKVRLIDNF